MNLPVIGVYPREPILLLGLHLPAFRDQVEVVDVELLDLLDVVVELLEGSVQLFLRFLR